MPVTYAQLKATNAEYDLSYWRRIRALYAGGRKLLGDADVMRDVFPSTLYEEDWVYKERSKRAYYVPYLPSLVDFSTAALSASPIEVTIQPNPDPWYDTFLKNVARRGSPRQSLFDLTLRQLHTALLLRQSWCLVDLPARDGALTPRTAAEEDRLGLASAYVLPIDPECVLDWEFDDAGNLLWAVVYSTAKRRASLSADRSTTEEIYTYYDREHWERYRVEYRDEKKPKDGEVITPVAEGAHSFGRVPLVRLSLPDGLWAGSKLESIAVEHFNQRNALSWGMKKGLFQFPAFTLAKPDPLNPAGDDPDRATNQTLAPGRAWVGQQGDSVQYVAPQTDPFRVAMEDLAVLRDEMYRVWHQMAMSIDNSAAALQRSGLSKQVDQAATAVILKTLGKYGREFAEDVVQMVAAGRGDIIEAAASGGDQFDEISRQDLLAQAVQLRDLNIDSPTFAANWQADVAKAWGVDDHDLELIKEELRRNNAGTAAERAGLLPEPPNGALQVVDFPHPAA